MKIIINYDLIEKIKEAKTGFSLIKTSKKVLLKSTFAEMLAIIISLFSTNPAEAISKNALQYFCFYVALYWIFEGIDINKNKNKALEEIKRLAIQLKNLNICTEQELLKGSYVYEKEHKLINQESSIFPKIMQKKYIMVPVYDDGEIKEVSLLQEHIVGSKNYVLSYGEPKKQKVFKPVFGSI